MLALSISDLVSMHTYTVVGGGAPHRQEQSFLLFLYILSAFCLVKMISKYETHFKNSHVVVRQVDFVPPCRVDVSKGLL